jgi:hypothetical protein
MKFLLHIFFLILCGCGDYLSVFGEKPDKNKPDAESNLKFVFNKNNSIHWSFSHNVELHKISSEALDMVNPVWSPNGTKILFAKPGDKNAALSSLGDLVIVDGNQKQIIAARVLKGWVDGVYIDGLRLIEEIGWFDNEHVFVSGSVNPNVVEFRLFDLTNGTELPGYLGTSFSVCPKYGKIAFFDYLLNKDYLSFVVNGHEVHKFQKKDDYYSLKLLKWVKDCTRLALVESETDQSNLLLINDNGSIEKKIKLPEHPILALKVIDDDLLLENNSGSFMVNVNDFSIIYDGNYKGKVVERLKIEKEFGVTSIDWYP